MTNQTDTLDFLTNAENLTPVLEIVHRADDIRAKVLSLFWTTLANRLRDTVPAAVAAGPLYWDADTTPAKSIGQFAGVALHIGRSESRTQELHFRIEQTNQPKCFELYFGLHWKQEVPETAVLAAKEPALMTLRTFQENNGFILDKNSWWWGWKYLREDSLRDEFLLDFSRSPGMVAEIASTFWSYVELVHALVSKANEAMIIAPPPKR